MGGGSRRLPTEKATRFMELIPIFRLSSLGTTDRPPSDGSGPGPELRGKTFGRQPFPPILPLHPPGETGAFFAWKRARPRKKIFQALPDFPSFSISTDVSDLSEKTSLRRLAGGAFLSICGRRRRLFLKSGHRCRRWERNPHSPAGARRDRPSGKGA